MGVAGKAEEKAAERKEEPAGLPPMKTLEDLTREAREQPRESVIVRPKAARMIAEAIRHWQRK
jgi:hypothetical protein